MCSRPGSSRSSRRCTAAALDHDGTWARFAGLAAIFVICFAVGLMSLVYFDQLIARRRRKDGFLSVGAAAVAEYEVRPGALRRRSRSRS